MVPEPQFESAVAAPLLNTPSNVPAGGCVFVSGPLRVFSCRRMTTTTTGQRGVPRAPSAFPYSETKRPQFSAVLTMTLGKGRCSRFRKPRP